MFEYLVRIEFFEPQAGYGAAKVTVIAEDEDRAEDLAIEATSASVPLTEVGDVLVTEVGPSREERESILMESIEYSDEAADDEDSELEPLFEFDDE